MRALAATSAAVLALGGLGAGAGLSVAKTPAKTTTYKVGTHCTKVGKTGKTAAGKKVVCTKVGKKLLWEYPKKK